MKASPAVPNWEALRALFPVLQHKTYLNSCSYGALATPVREAFGQYLDTRDAKGSDWDWWVTQNENVRRALAEFLQVDSDEVAITPSASAGINALASALRFDGTRNKVVISDFEFPTNGQIWYAQESRGAKVVRVPAEHGYIPAERFADFIDDDTLLVAVTNVCFRNGARLDIAAIAEIARSKGALILVDGYQALGALQLEPRKLGIDFLAGGCLKYLLGTAGIGFFYVRQPLAQTLEPTVTGWFAQTDIGAMDHTRNEPSPTARRFESGTPPVVNAYAAAAGVGVLQSVGMPQVERKICSLVDQVIDEAQRAGYRIITPLEAERHGPMLNIACSDPQRVVALLDEADVVISCRDSAIRVAPHFYNNAADIGHLFEELKKHESLIERAD